MLKLTALLALLVTACSETAATLPDASTDAASCASHCGPAPVAFEVTPTYSPDGATVTMSRADYEKVVTFRDRAITYVSCRLFEDAQH